MTGISFAKGHGTGNDFVVLPDAEDEWLTESMVQALCDRRRGIGGDGVLRVVTDSTGIFMDYRNADGSLAEMCGNGIRVFARYLVDHGLAEPGRLAIGTRAGTIEVDCPEEGDIEVHMGIPSVPLARAIPVVSVADRSWPASPVVIPNPHAVVFVESLADAGDLTAPPDVAPGIFADGVNVEFVVDMGTDHIAMRVHERGVGETLSCGTGACAAAWATRRRDGRTGEGIMRVDVPGGTVWVRETPMGGVTLIGPAVIVAEGVLDEAWCEAVR